MERHDECRCLLKEVGNNVNLTLKPLYSPDPNEVQHLWETGSSSKHQTFRKMVLTPTTELQKLGECITKSSEADLEARGGATPH